jgi:hypothetical protein
MRLISRAAFWPADSGRFASLPNGRQIDLYTAFPSNGVFRLPDLQPIYFIDWFNYSNRFVWSSNFDSLAFINEFALAEPTPRSHSPSTNALQFYSFGKVSRSYSAPDIVESPVIGSVPQDYVNSLLFPTWLTSFRLVNNRELEVITAPRGIFLFGRQIVFSPGNRIVFDLITGSIVSENRHLQSRGVIVVTFIIAALTAWWFFSRRASPVESDPSGTR